MEVTDASESENLLEEGPARVPPSEGDLHWRHIEPTAFCEVCGADRETIKHILTECAGALMFWREVKTITGVKLPNLHPVSWASEE